MLFLGPFLPSSKQTYMVQVHQHMDLLCKIVEKEDFLFKGFFHLYSSSIFLLLFLYAL